MSRVTKVTKGGKNMSFRATVVVGDGKGKVGVGCAKAKEAGLPTTPPPLSSSTYALRVASFRGMRWVGWVVVRDS